METTKNLSLQEMMKWAHDLEEIQQNVDMVNSLLDINIVSILKKEQETE